jgi:hypothetical protein
MQLQSKTPQFASQVWACALITVDPPDFLGISISFHLHSIQHSFPVPDFLICFCFSILSISCDVIPSSSSGRTPSLNLRCRSKSFDYLIRTISLLRTGMSMIPAHLLDLERSISFTPVKMELDGGGEGAPTSFATSNQCRTEALFSDAHRSRCTTPVTKAAFGRGSSWDESDSESEAEIVGTIHTSDAPWSLFNVQQRYVVRPKAMEKALENFEEACDEDTLLKLRPLMAEFVGKLRWSLSDSMESKYILTDVDSSTTWHPELSQWRRDGLFPVKLDDVSEAGREGARWGRFVMLLNASRFEASRCHVEPPPPSSPPVVRKRITILHSKQIRIKTDQTT